jgi:hypothetical protein
MNQTKENTMKTNKYALALLALATLCCGSVPEIVTRPPPAAPTCRQQCETKVLGDCVGELVVFTTQNQCIKRDSADLLSACLQQCPKP